MKKLKGLVIITILLSFIMLGFTSTIKDVKAEESNLVAMKKHNGQDFTYRGSDEKVYRLAEYNYPTSQFRAVWVSAFVGDISSYKNEQAFKQELNGLLDNMESWGMNALVFHVRTHNNALYKSELNPLASWFSNVDFDTFDPVAWLIDECHARGIEFHAWLNPYRVPTPSSGIPSYAAEPLPKDNIANNTEYILTGNSSILNPGEPAVRNFLVDTCMELIENYDVDAINFDDYFYVNGLTDKSDEVTRRKYNLKNLSVADFRREAIDLFIEDLSKHIREYNQLNNKAVQLGIAPSGIYRNGGYVKEPTYDNNGNLTNPIASNTAGMEHYGGYLYADTLNWINHEWIDYIMPQLYWATEHDVASFVELTKWWSWAVKNKKVNFYAGLGIYMALSTTGSGQYWQYNDDEIQRQLLNAGQYKEFGGACFYKYASLLNTSNKVIKNAIDLISNDYWSKRVPAAVSKYYAPLIEEVAPTNVIYDSTTSSIKFDVVDNARGYMIYQVPKGEALDKNNINHVYEYTTKNSISITNIDDYNYYVASVNKANETSEVVLVNTSQSYQEACQEIDDYVASLDFNTKEMTKIKAMAEDAKGSISAMTSQDAINSAINDFISEVVNYHEGLESARRGAQTALENLVLTSYSDAQKEVIEDIISDTMNQIKASADEDEINTLKNTGIDSINEYITSLNAYILDAKTTLSKKDASTKEAKDYLDEITKKIEAASSKEEIDELLSSVDSKLAEFSDKNTCASCNKQTIIYMFLLTVFTPLVIYLIRKH